MKIISIILIMGIVFSCGSNKNVLRYLKTCHDPVAYQNGYYKTTVEELKSNLKSTEKFRYLGSDDEFHYLVHYYDKLTKLQTGFKLPILEFAIIKEIDYINNSRFEKKHGKFRDSYFIKLGSM